MKLTHKALLMLWATTLGLAHSPTSASAEQWYFWVENDSNTAIKSLLVSEDGKKWGYFDIGSGIAPGDKEKMLWNESANDESCAQWIKAEFSDGQESEAAQINFCQKVDDPIVFSN